jgi:hypothetical protein
MENEEANPVVNYTQKGFTQAGESGGGFSSFKLRIRGLYNDLTFKKESETNNEVGDAGKKIADNKGEIETLNAKIEGTRTQTLPVIDKEIEDKRLEIKKIDANPDDFSLPEPDLSKVYIGGTILLFITLYLFIFYSSAFYQAIYADSSDSSVSDALFNPNAFTDALTHGATALIFISFIPFVFLGMGYWIHLLEEKGSKYGKLGVFCAAFVVDAILAHTIEMKILKHEAYATGIDPTFFSPFQTSGFWLIIFCGYVAYIIWGILLTPIMDEVRKMNQSEYAKKIRREQIKQLEERKKGHNDRLSELLDKVAHLRGENIRLEEDMNKVVISFAEFKPAADKFVMGWENFNQGSGLAQDKRDEQLLWYQDVLDRLKDGSDNLWR